MRSSIQSAHVTVNHPALVVLVWNPKGRKITPHWIVGSEQSNVADHTGGRIKGLTDGELVVIRCGLFLKKLEIIVEDQATTIPIAIGNRAGCLPQAVAQTLLVCTGLEVIHMAKSIRDVEDEFLA